MGQKYTFTKEQAIEAVKNEPLLRPHNFFHVDPDMMEDDDVPDNRECPVCAIGSILRRLIPDLNTFIDAANFTNHTYGSSVREIDKAYDSGYFPSILSCEFEKFWSLMKEETSMTDIEIEPLAREHALKIIEAHCPPVFEYEVE